MAGGPSSEAREQAARRAAPLVTLLAEAERERAAAGEGLRRRTDELALLFGITTILGQTARLEDAARTVARELAGALGARRASVMVPDAAGKRLRILGAWGFEPGEEDGVSLEDEQSVAASVFTHRRPLTERSAARRLDAPDTTRYGGGSFCSVPITYGSAGAIPACLGVLSVADRIGGDAFSAEERKLVEAIAAQLGAALENARLIVRDRQHQRLRRELELAHDLQLRLLPTPAVLHGDAEVAARSTPAESVGGDFYTFNRLGDGRVGVMLGDVSSHGFSAALVMALVLSAAGIHAAQGENPDEALDALLDSVSDELRSTDMYFTVFYGVLDRAAGTLHYANAGHPYAWRIPRAGEPERLTATCAPLGLVAHGGIERRVVPWYPGDLLVLFTDGLVEERNAEREPYGEARLLGQVVAHRHASPDALVAAVLADADAWAERPADDRTLLVLRV